MTHHDQKFDYSVHPDSLLYAGPAANFPLTDRTARPSSFMRRLKVAMGRLLKSGGPQTRSAKPKKIDRYERA